MLRSSIIAAFVIGGCCSEPGDYTRAVDTPGARGEVRLRRACSDGCDSSAATGSVQLIDSDGVVVAAAPLDDENGRFVVEASGGPYTLEIAALGTEVDRSLDVEIMESSGFELRRTYDERYNFLDLFVIFDADVTQTQQEELLSNEPGILLNIPAADNAYLVTVEEHPQLVGESLDSRYDEVVGFQLSDIGCPGGGG